MDANSDWARGLASGSVDERIATLRKISNQSDPVTGVTILCVQMAGDSDDDVRMWAAEALAHAVTPLPAEVDSLADLLRHSDDGEIDYWAATMLGRLKTQAAAAVDALQSCVVNSMYLPARERAVWALAEIGPAAADAIQTLETTAEAAPPRLKRLAKEAIKSIGNAA
ncbi:HEAT repeat domain-containing protein [Novipirellula caenicola]|uniref:HEAT repeat protein n=1 Tax=Novipirellula caenicola TaxID=1536901 RepID=A0ABP9VKL5_9BACT